MSAIPYPSPRLQKSWPLALLQALLIGFILFVIGVVCVIAIYEWSYAGQIYPGVAVYGIDLTGLTPAQAAQRIAQGVAYPQHGRILLHDGTQTWTVSPAEVGFFLDPESSAVQAYQIGRQGSLPARLIAQSDAWFTGKSLAPTLVFDQRIAQSYLLSLARQIDKPIIEANLGLNGAEVVVHSGQVGRSLDTTSALSLLTQQLATLRDGAITLPVRETKPVILDASAQAAVARRILSAPLVLDLPDRQDGDPGPWTFDPQTLAGMLSIEKVQNGGEANYQIVINADSLREFLANLAPDLQRDPKMPKFTFDEDSKQLVVLEHAVIGRSLDIDTTVETINEKLDQGEHSIQLVFHTNPPAVTDDATAEQLGITGLIHSESSYFYGSGASRVQNITIAAKNFNGVLVAPGEVFSMGAHMSDVTLDNGYAEALIIVGDQTVKGVGGGVCQVSTTLFRAAFFTGFPIVERHAHAYRVTYYEKTAGNRIDPNLAGMDATVYFPLVDMKFKNDTPYWLLMETVVNPSGVITWKFYSTADNRTVDWNTTGLTNITKPPDPIYRENPDLAKGDIKQVDWAVQGAEVTVHRTVTRDGETLLQDTFYTHFEPWRDIFEYGPGTENIPTPAPTPTPTP